jgi:mono/diheme cytochrome c family protein
VTAAQPDASQGAAVFEKHCAICHRIGDKGAKIGPNLDGAEFALEMIRYPYRQVFGDPSQGGVGNIRDVFRVSISMTQLKAKFLATI